MTPPALIVLLLITKVLVVEGYGAVRDRAISMHFNYEPLSGNFEYVVWVNAGVDGTSADTIVSYRETDGVQYDNGYNASKAELVLLLAENKVSLVIHSATDTDLTVYGVSVKHTNFFEETYQVTYLNDSAYIESTSLGICDKETTLANPVISGETTCTVATLTMPEDFTGPVTATLLWKNNVEDSASETDCSYIADQCVITLHMSLNITSGETLKVDVHFTDLLFEATFHITLIVEV